MSQTPNEGRRKCVLVLSPLGENPVDPQRLIDALVFLAKKFRWKLEASHTVSVNAKIQVLDGPQT